MARKIIQLNNLISTIEKASKEQDEKKIILAFEKYKNTKQ